MTEEHRKAPEELVQAFARKLRDIRESSGLAYQEIERRSGCPHEQLHAATRGDMWLDWKTVEAFATACGGDIEELRTEWRATNAALGDNAAKFRHEPLSGKSSEAASVNADAPSEERPHRVGRLRRVVVVLGAVIALIAVVAISALSLGGGAHERPDGTASPTSSTRLDPTPTPSSPEQTSTSVRQSGSQDPPTSRTPTSEEPTKDTRTTTQVPTDTPQDPDRLEDPGRLDNKQEDEVVELVQQNQYPWRDIEYWRRDTSRPGEVQIDAQGVFTNLGAKLTIIADTPLANRDRCAGATGWRDRIEFSELHVGSQLCALSRVSHYASMEIRLLPGSPGSNGSFIFYGITWWG